MRVKNREIDILIVVNMFLTGFDATTLNTLWVDKNLRMHGLIQAFSRTNRILNSVKTFGNIVCFRDLQQQTDEAIGLFGDKDAAGIVLIRTFDEYYNGYTDENGKRVKGYKDLIADLIAIFPLGEPITGEKAEKDFIALWGKILKMRNLLSSFDDFADKGILADRDLQDYQSVYIDMYGRYRDHAKVEKESITDDVVFEMELVRQVEVNIDYILMLVARYHKENCKDKAVKGAIDKAIGSSLELRSKRELIEAFIASVNAEGSVEEQWMAFVREQKGRDLEALIVEENLKHDESVAFFDGALRDGFLKTTGTDVDLILPPMSRFGGGSNREEKKQAVVAKLQILFDRYKGLIA